MALVSVWCLLWFIPNNTEPPQSHLDLAPSLIPMVAMSTCLVTSIMLIIAAWRAPKSADNPDDDEFGVEATGATADVMVNFSLWIFAAAVSWLLMAYVGFEPAMAVFLSATMYFVGVRQHWVVAVVAVVTPIVLSQLVWYLFSTEMPGFWRE